MIGSSFLRYADAFSGMRDLSSAKCVAVWVESGSNGSLSCIWFQVRLRFHLTWDNMSLGDSQRHCPKVPRETGKVLQGLVL